MTASISLRPATREDCPAILAIYNDAVLTTTATYDVAPRTLEHREAWFDERRRQNLPVLVAVDGDGAVLGWGCLNRFHDRHGYRFTVENSIYVAAPHRGQGIGKRLLAPLIDAARERGFHAIIAGIDAGNPASVRLHAAFGFVEVGRFREVGHKFGRWLDVVYLELMLETPLRGNPSGGPQRSPA